MSDSYVLDSYALLAYLQHEKGGVQVRDLLRAADQGYSHVYMCLVNLGEVMYILERESGVDSARDTLGSVERLPIDTLPADRQLCLAAAHIKAHCPVAYGDCFAAALSQLKSAAVITGDPEFRKIKIDPPLQIEWLP